MKVQDFFVAGQVPSRYCIPAWYVVPITLAANAIGATSLTMDGDSTFRLTGFQGTCDQDVATDESPNNFGVKITLQTGRVLTSPATSFISQRIICPTQSFYSPLTWQVDFAPKDIINFEFINKTANVNNVEFVLVGYKLFPGL